MSDMKVVPIESLGYGFIPEPYLPAGKDEYYLRNAQSARPAENWRNLRAVEIEILVKGGNTADDWANVLVTDQFTPQHIRNCKFHGLVRIGRLKEECLEHHDLRIPVGITNSRIISCDIGDDVAIHDVRYLAHYIIDRSVVLLNLDEMHCTNYAKFGNGIVKDGEDESVRVWMELINETGGRAVMPFDGMLAADAYMWARYRNDAELMARLGEITQKQFDSRRGFYGTIGQGCVIKNCRIIKDVKIGPCAYVKSANKLKNLTINSSSDEPTQIGEGVELVNGIIGRGCHVFYGCKAVRFVLGDNSSLKYGARLIHSFLGDNSTISCCEVLNNLVFPAHEQHHNNSFLIASLVMGQSNIAACATIGSNHNSRAPDGEIHAGRGFWPGLCVSLKHFCRFASFTLLAKGDFPAEMDIPLPFSLVSDDVTHDCLRVIPAYWWLYNMYALARNTWKFNARDKRERKLQNIEFDSLAPDTAEEMFAAMELLEQWTAKASLRAEGKSVEDKEPDALARLGRELLNGPAEAVNKLEVLGERMEHSRRKVVILKPRAGYHAYRRMLHYYAVKNLLAWMQQNDGATLAAMTKALAAERQTQWVNLGGQLVTGGDFEKLRTDIRSGKLASWDAVHAAYDKLWEKYPLDKQRHAFAALRSLVGELTAETWKASLDEAVRIQQFVCDQTRLSRKKDFDNPFRRMTFDSDAEMRAVMGDAEENSFVKQVSEETEAFEKFVKSLFR